MKLPINWLKDYVDIPNDVTHLTDKLTAIGHMQDKPPVKVGNDTVLDLEIRQNRSDCLSVIGLARETAAILKHELRLPASLDTPLPKVSKSKLIEIENPELCYRFQALGLRNITVGESPAWLKDKLEAYGIRSINNLVDITNFVMVEIGEPLHAFDATKVTGTLHIRVAKNGETLQILGNKTIRLTPADLVIADEKQVLSLAGMIGGTDSAISDTTTEIILEAATYRQSSIRRSSLRHSLRTEASLRHEKFLHPDLTEVTLRRAAQLIQELCGATIVEHVDDYPQPVKETKIRLRISRLQRLGGLPLTLSQAQEILDQLQIANHKLDDQSLEIKVPYFRTDLEQEEDVIEEVLRIHGYDKIPDQLPSSPVPKDLQSPSYSLEENIRDILAGFGFDEQITEPLTKEDQPVSKPVVLQNSLNSEKTMLRTTLKNGLVNALNYQKKFHKTEISLFELGKIYYKDNAQYVESKMLGGIMAGKGMTYFHLKGMAEAVCLKLGYVYHESIIAYEIIDNHTFYFDLKLDDLMDLPKTETQMIRTSINQSIFQDISLSVPNSIPVGDLLAAVITVSPLIHRVDLGENPRDLGQGRKSVFIKLQFSQDDQPLSSADVEPIQRKLMEMLKTKFQAELR